MVDAEDVARLVMDMNDFPASAEETVRTGVAFLVEGREVEWAQPAEVDGRWVVIGFDDGTLALARFGAVAGEFEVRDLGVVSGGSYSEHWAPDSTIRVVFGHAVLPGGTLQMEFTSLDSYRQAEPMQRWFRGSVAAHTG